MFLNVCPAVRTQRRTVAGSRRSCKVFFSSLFQFFWSSCCCFQKKLSYIDCSLPAWSSVADGESSWWTQLRSWWRPNQSWKEWNDFRWTLPCTFYQMKVVSMPNLTYSYFVEPSSSGQIRVCACLRLIVTQVIDRLSVRLLISIFIAGGTKITLSIYIGQYTHIFLQISLKCGYQTGTTWFVVEAEHFTD